jgi:transposase
MPYIPKPIDRYQVTMDSLDTMVPWDSMARVIDCFVDHLDLKEMGFTKTDPSFEGRPCFDPASLLKLYFYGYRNSIRFSRKLAKACETNIEVIWMLGGLKPDDRIKWLDDHTQEYLRLIEEADKEEDSAGTLPSSSLFCVI